MAYDAAMRLLLSCVLLFSLGCRIASATQAPADTILASTGADGFPLVVDGRAATLVVDPHDAPLVSHAARDLADDISLVTGTRPALGPELRDAHVVVIGTLGVSRNIDRLVADGKLDVRDLRGAWESFVIATVEQPFPGVKNALVIAGSDRRGTAFGVYELSSQIGVSPWVWWADVRPARHDTLRIASGLRRFGPPSVRYRGIFINDEDWGLIPWAAGTFDPEKGNLGPKTYREVFRLLLRLKANTLWPAMHRTSTPFNADPANARLADEYGIVMGSSHAEPMLRNNVGEWHDKPELFNYATNAQGVRSYWEDRVRTNAKYESLWTLGMRGIHDSGMVGGQSDVEKIALLERIFTDQRELLRKHVAANVPAIPQMFVPYKEVLSLYEGGLRVPDDVTIVWPDDNFGYIRRFPTEAERKRRGGSGIYYHLSYLGVPLSYLWLSTTPPALTQVEMTRAYDLGARQLWIVNAGDIKPAEIGLTHFLDLAWDVGRTRNETQRSYLERWAARTFGSEHASIGSTLDEYYRLNFERRPEHLQWWIPGEKPRRSGWAASEVDARLQRFDSLVARVSRTAAAIRPDQRDAYFQLIDYPVSAAAAANRRYFQSERYALLIDDEPQKAREAAQAAITADEEVRNLTARFNNEIANGKWKHLMAEEPADNQWASMRLSRLSLPVASLVQVVRPLAQQGRESQPAGSQVVVQAESVCKGAGWRIIEGLGRGDGSLFAPDVAARITCRVVVPEGASKRFELGLLPLFPSHGEEKLVLDVAVDRGASRRIEIPRQTGSREWSQGVLDNLLSVPATDSLAPGTREITIEARGGGIALDQLVLRPAGP